MRLPVRAPGPLVPTLAALVLASCSGPAPAGPDPGGTVGRAITIEKAWRWGHALDDGTPVALRVQGIYEVVSGETIEAGPAKVPSFGVSVKSEGGQWVKVLPTGEEVVEEAYSTRVGRTVKTSRLALADLLPRRGDVSVPTSAEARAAMMADDKGRTFTGEGFLVRCGSGDDASRTTLATPACQGCEGPAPQPSSYVTCRGK